MHPLLHVRAKIFRSRDHLHALDREITSFLSRNPYEVLSDFDVKQRTYTYRAKAREEVPLLIRVLSGETAGQLRSALDHLAWQLALLTTSSPFDKTAFPVSRTAENFKDNRRVIRDLSSEAQTIIDELQPYRSQNPETCWLSVLDRFANHDKHRLLHVVGAAPRGITVDRHGRDIWVDMRIGAFNDQTEIGHVRFENPSETNVEVQTQIVFDLAFAETPGKQFRPVRETLAMLGKEVELVIRKFRHFFPD